MTREPFIFLFLCVHLKLARLNESCQGTGYQKSCWTENMNDNREPEGLFRWTSALKTSEVLPFDGAENPIRVLSDKPLILEALNFLSSDECDHLIALAEKEGLQESETKRSHSNDNGNIRLMDTNGDKRLSVDEMILTIQDSFDLFIDESDVLQMYLDLNLDKNGDQVLTPEELAPSEIPLLKQYLLKFAELKPTKRSRMSSQTWLYADSSDDEVFLRIQSKVQQFTKLPQRIIKRSGFQVVKYIVGGHYNAHHDSSPIDKNVPCCTSKLSINCRICRFATILFYLNEVEEGGETAFPVAENRTYNEYHLRNNHLMNLQKSCSESNLVVRPKKGKAVLWYNHFVDETTGRLGELDEFTLHGGCPVIKGHKWIANFWIKLD